MVPARSQRHELPEDLGGIHAGFALQPLLDLLLVLSEQGAPARGVSALLLGLSADIENWTSAQFSMLLDMGFGSGWLSCHKSCRLLRNRLSERCSLLACSGSTAPVLGLGSGCSCPAERLARLATVNRFQQGDGIAAALQFLQRLPLGIPELAKRQQPFLWCAGRMVASLEFGVLKNRFLELERGLVEIGEQLQGPSQVPLQLGGHQALQPFVAHHKVYLHAVIFFNPARPQFDRRAQAPDRR